MAGRLAELVAENGGTAYFVGGYVRDKLRHKESKDIDIEVHGIKPEKLEEILDSLGERISIGESFGIYNLKGYSIDIAMPRKEDNRGSGHRDFDICVDPFIGTYKAAERRDFTFNALMENVLTGEIVDHFGGVQDLENGIIRHVNDVTFQEDPLRVLRAAQFAARFDYTVADETMELCRRMDLSALSKERVMGELEKALLKSQKPSVFFEKLRQMDQLSVWFPELENTISIKQPPKHHAEGDVWNHTMLVCNEAVRCRERVSNPLGFMLAAITHDFGKVISTTVVDGKIHAYNHEITGLPLAEAFMKRLTTEKELIKYVLNLGELHMKPNMLAADNASVKATNKMFDSAVDPEALICLALSDAKGSISADGNVTHEEFLTKRLEIFKEYMSRPYVMGRDLIEAGMKPSERFTDYLKFAHKLRLAGVSKENTLRQVLALARKNGDYEGNY
ncbi:MAG: tRNA nucleotidyltransferase [Oscillospiraceae bacterium]|nr:tRNA nucleotidyltransferase [Oscillospiraceae bacterium]